MKKEYWKVEVLLKTGTFLIEKTTQIGCGGLGGIYVGMTAKNGDCVGTTVGDREKIDIAKFMVLEYALKQEKEKLSKQDEIVGQLDDLKKQYWY